MNKALINFFKHFSCEIYFDQHKSYLDITGLIKVN